MSLATQIAPYERLTLPLEPELGQCMLSVREVLALTPGSVIPLARAVGSKIDVLVGGAPFGLAEFVSSGNSLALRFSSFCGEEPAGRNGKTKEVERDAA